MVLLLVIFKSLIHLEFIFTYDMRKKFSVIMLHVPISLPQTISGRNFFLIESFLCPVGKQFAIDILDLFLDSVYFIYVYPYTTLV